MTDLNTLGVPLERKGMKILEVFTKLDRQGRPHQRMVRVLCPCGAKFTSTLSRWRHHLMDSCRKCALKKGKNIGLGVFAGGKNLRSRATW